MKIKKLSKFVYFAVALFADLSYGQEPAAMAPPLKADPSHLVAKGSEKAKTSSKTPKPGSPEPLLAETASPDFSIKELLQDTVESSAPPQYTWTLDDVVKIAESRNPDIKAARANYEAARATITQAWSGLLPHADVEGQFDRTTLPSPSAGISNQLGTGLPYTSVVASVRQTIFDFGKVINEVGARNAQTHANQADALALKNAVLLHAEMGFYNVAASEQLVKVAEQGVVKFRETLRRTSVMVRTGNRPKFDLTQASVEMTRAQLALLNAKNTSDLSRITLLNIMGLSREATFKLVEGTPTEMLDLRKMSLNRIAKLAVLNRPEVKRAEYSSKAAEMLLHREYKEYLPTISAEGFYGKYLPNYPTDIADSWGAGIVLRWNLFDGLKTSGKVEEMSARLTEQTARLEKQQEDVTSDVANSYMDLRRAEASLQLAHQSLGYATENASLARKRYEANVASFLELLVAETSLLDNQAADVQARYQYEIAIATLKNAVNLPLKEILQ